MTEVLTIITFLLLVFGWLFLAVTLFIGVKEALFWLPCDPPKTAQEPFEESPMEGGEDEQFLEGQADEKSNSGG